MGVITMSALIEVPSTPYTDFEMAKKDTEKVLDTIKGFKDKYAGKKGCFKRTSVVRSLSYKQVISMAHAAFLFRRRGIMNVSKHFTICINPKILKAWGSRKTEEGCQSYPSRKATCERHRFVLLEFYDLNGKKHVRLYGPHNAHVIEHEICHILGRKFYESAL